jgi:hypothetical protein
MFPQRSFDTPSAPSKATQLGDLQAISSKPSDGLEPSTPSLPSSDEAGTEGNRWKPRARKPRKH